MPDTSPDLTGAKLLLVDDTPANLKVLGDLLEAEGYDVMEAPLQGARPTATLRHDPRSLALAVMRFYRKHKRDA